MTKNLFCFPLIIALLLFLGGCNSGAANHEETDNTAEEQTKTEEVTASNAQEELLVNFFDAWNKKDSDAMAAMVFHGYGYQDIAGDMNTTESISLLSLEDISEAEGAAEGEKVYKAVFNGAFSDDGAASGFIDGENAVKLLLLYDDEHLQWLITQWEKY